ncbi:MAG: Bax inhibitor-1/YccA family protein [Chloroflexi bacterium]|nr:Bax inhibitor-1/YccA family protein [Chloroflexota bacterium]
MTTPSYQANQVETRVAPAASAALLTHAFTWMFAGLLLTAGVAAFVQGAPGLKLWAAQNILLLFIGQLALVLIISFAITRIAASLALLLFFVYAASLGLVVGLIVSAYTGESVATAFLSASAMFGGAALYGWTTKRSLAGIGGMLTMGVIGLIVASVVNVFLGSSPIGWFIALAGVVIFTALTAYHIQRIASGALVAATGSVEKAAVYGALALYLDFINIFLFLLRLLGGRR